ncbi:hypothetical protein D3C75_1098200 [compost metagenome]
MNVLNLAVENVHQHVEVLGHPADHRIIGPFTGVCNLQQHLIRAGHQILGNLNVQHPLHQ